MKFWLNTVIQTAGYAAFSITDCNFSRGPKVHQTGIDAPS